MCDSLLAGPLDGYAYSTLDFGSGGIPSSDWVIRAVLRQTTYSVRPGLSCRPLSRAYSRYWLMRAPRVRDSGSESERPVSSRRDSWWFDERVSRGVLAPAARRAVQYYYPVRRASVTGWIAWLVHSVRRPGPTGPGVRTDQYSRSSWAVWKPSSPGHTVLPGRTAPPDRPSRIIGQYI